MAPASKLSKRTPLSDASSDEEDDSSSESGSENGMEEESFPELTIDVTKLNPLSPEVIQKQATINIGVYFFHLFIVPMFLLLFMRDERMATMVIEGE